MNIDISKIWPGWVITERLGHGGFGHVYKAVCASAEAVAAVKVISIPDNTDIIEDLRYSGRSDDEILSLCLEEAEHMMEEIKVMQKLKGSANIVSIEDSALRKKEDSIGYDIYIRMEYLMPLQKHIAEIVPLTDEAVVKIGCDICSALEICHKKTANKRQIIHRDIKPDNILYHELSDAYKLGDFGIARERFDTARTLTRGIGTARFIAPEVEAGTAYDHRVDLYSLGLVLYSLRNRDRLPFEYFEQKADEESVSRAKWKRIHGDEPLPPPVDASPALAEVILKACAYEPKDRYASAADMKEALLKALKQPNEISSKPSAEKSVPSPDAVPEPAKIVLKPKKNVTVKWIFGIAAAGVILYNILPFLSPDEMMGDDTITYEDTSGTDPETAAEPVIETINTALVAPTEEDIQSGTKPETESIEETIPETEAVQNIPVEVTSPAVVMGGATKEEASLINLEVTYTFDGSNGNQGEEWYTFTTSPNQSVYFLSVSEHDTAGMLYYQIYDADHHQILSESINNEEETLGIALNSDTEYWLKFQNTFSCTYILSITEQQRDGGISRTEAFPIALNTSYNKKIEIPQLPDWYRITTTANQSVYRFALDKNVSDSVIFNTVYMTLYDADGIKVKDVGIWENIGFYDLLLEPETDYYLKIQGGDHYTCVGDYALQVSERPCDTGTDKETATVLELSKRHTGTLDSTLSDWYQLAIPAAGRYTFTIHNIDIGADITFRGTKEPADADPIFSTLKNEDSYTRSFHANEGAILYLEIFSDAYNANGTYILEITPEES